METYKKYIIRVNPQCYLGVGPWDIWEGQTAPEVANRLVSKTSINNAYPFASLPVAWQIAKWFGGEVIVVKLGQVVTQYDYDAYKASGL